MAPRHNPVYDLLAFLVGEKYKEPVNKPAIVAPTVEKKDASTLMKPTTRTFSTQMETVMENVKPIEIHEKVQTAEIETQTEKKQYYPRSTYGYLETEGGGVENLRKKVEEDRKGTLYDFFKVKGPEISSPLGMIVTKLQASTDAGSVSNVDFS